MSKPEHKDSCDECKRLRAQRDYYRRRWYVHGLNYGHYFSTRAKYVAAVMDALTRARKRDNSSGS